MRDEQAPDRGGRARRPAADLESRAAVVRELGLIEPLGGGRYRLADLTGLRMVAGERQRR